MPSTQGSIDSTSLRSVVDSIKSGWKRRVDVLTDAKSHLQDMVPSQPAGVLAPPAGDYRKLLAGHSDRTEWITGSMSHAEKEGVANRNAEDLHAVNAHARVRLTAFNLVWQQAVSQLALTHDELQRVKRCKDYCGRTFITRISQTGWAGLSAGQSYEVDQLSVRFSTPTADTATATEHMFLRLKSTGNNPSAEGASLDCNTTAPPSVQQPNSILVEFDMRRRGRDWELKNASPSAWPEGVPEPGPTSQGWITLDTRTE